MVQNIKKPLLSICVLTYNREHHLSRILNFLNDEYQSLNNKDQVEIIISDNCSTDRTEQIITEFINQNNLIDWEYNRNTKNTGLLGNLLISEKLSTGEYLWWWGDDDNYKEGIVKTVLNHLEANPDYLLLNHSASREKPWDGLAFRNALEGLDLESLNIEDIIRKNPGAIMFMSSSIYRREALICLHSEKYKKNIALPLLYSLGCASNGNYIIETNVWIDDNYKDITWTAQSKNVFNDYIPYYLSLMPELGYDLAVSKSIYDNYRLNLKRQRLKANIRTFLDKTNCLGIVKNIFKKFK